MTRSPSGPNPAQWGRPEPLSFGTDCTDGCVWGRLGAEPGSRASAALEGIRERNTHRHSASNPYDHRRFVNFVAPYASEPYLTKSYVRLRVPKSSVRPVNQPVERYFGRGMRRIQGWESLKFLFYDVAAERGV